MKIERTVNGRTLTATIELRPCEDAETPRDHCNLGTMVCWHSRHVLGDDAREERGQGAWLDEMLFDLGICQDHVYMPDTVYDYVPLGYYDKYGNLRHYRPRLVEKTRVDWDTFIEKLTDNDLHAIEKAWKLLEPHVIEKPLYLYDHSGLSMATSVQGTWWHYRWDGGQVGWIYVTRERASAEFGGGRLTRQRRERIEDRLDREVAIYNQWLSGDVWDFEISVLDEDDNELAWDGGGGYYGHAEAQEIAEVEAENMLDQVFAELAACEAGVV